MSTLILPWLRPFTGGILTALSVAFAVYIVCTMLYREKRVVLKGSYLRMLRYELTMCAAFVLVSADIGWGIFTWPPVIWRCLGILLRISAALLASAGLFLAVRIILCGRRVHPVGGYLVVLGMALEDGKPTKDLLNRLNTAKACAEKHPETVLVLTGGNGNAQSRSEAEVMRDLLAASGIPSERMILEDRSVDTLANFRNVSVLIGSDSRVTICTNGYHMNRALRIAAEAGFKDPGALPAPSEPVFYGAHVLWEVIAEMDRLWRRIRMSMTGR